MRAALTAIFALTGFSALALQVVWQRVISLHGGVDLFSTTTVVAAFLGGLGVGSLLGGRLADALGAKRSVLAFAGSNLAIAAFSLLSLWLFYDVYRSLVDVVDGLVASFLFHAVLLIVPTTLMGLSLPLVARGVVARSGEIGPLVGRLYAVNTLGAAIGAAATGWFLLGTFGFEGTVRIAAGLNALAAVLVFAVWRVAATARVSPADEVYVDGPPELDRTIRTWPWLAAYGLTGALALALEIVFFRVVDTVMRSNSYTFGHVLSLYLLLFAVGSAVGSRAVRNAVHPERGFLVLQGVAGVTAIAGLHLLIAPARFEGLPGHGFLVEYFRTDGLATGFDALDARRLLFTNLLAPLAVMAGPVVSFGAAFPFIQAAVARRVDTLGRRTGALLFANIAGNVAGTLVAGFLLLHYFGTVPTLLGIAAVLGVLGVTGLLFRRRRAPVLALLLAGAVVAGAVTMPTNRRLYALLHSAEGPFDLEEERSCVDALVGRETDSVLTINGATQNAHPYDEFHVLIGLMPTLMHADPTASMAVGLGVGATTYGLALDRRVDNVHTVEICGGQVDLLRLLAERGSATSRTLFDDKRVELEEGDGRKHLLDTDESYDVITVDTLRPESGYSGNLYSIEFYELVRDRLRDGGLFAQWAPTARARTTVTTVFPHVVEFRVPSFFNSPFVVASERPIAFDRASVAARYAASPSSDAGLHGALRAFLATSSPQPVPHQPGEVNRDLRPRDEYFLND